MQNNDFNKMNGFIAKLTQAATKGMERKTTFKKMTAMPTAELKENSRTLASFENGLGQTKGMD